MSGLELAIVIVMLGLLFDYTNGAHDAANVVSTVIATRALAPFTAILLAAVLNAIGATQVGGVAKTITTGLIDPKAATQVMIICSLFGAIIWNLLTAYYGIPCSSSYSLIGGLIGAAFVNGGAAIIEWDGLMSKVLIPMVLSPLVGFGLAYILMKILYYFSADASGKKRAKTFRSLQVLSSSLVALAHGLNDAQKSMGIITLGLFASGILHAPIIPLWVILACALTMGLGTAIGGYRTIKTVGFKLTKIAPVQGFAIELSASSVILLASFLGMPISSTQMVVGSVTGAGTAKQASAVHWDVAYKLIGAWVLTFPIAGILAAGAYKMLNTFGIF